METCISKKTFRCIYLTKENYEELIKEDYPDYKSEYINIEITDEGVLINTYDMVHLSKVYPFGWWVEEDIGNGYLDYGYNSVWNHYTDYEFKNSFQKNKSDKVIS